MKEKTKKIIIVFATALLAVGLFAVVVVVRESNKPTSLSQYIVDNEVELFVEIDMQDSNWNNYISQNKNIGLFLNNFFLKNELPKELFENDFNIEIEKLALAIVRIDEGLKKVWLIKVNDDVNDLSLYMSGYYFSVLDADTGILSLSKEPIDKIKFKKEDSLFFGYGNNFFADYNKGFVNVRASESFLDGDNLDFSFGQGLLTNYFNLEKGDFVYFNFDIRDNKIVFSWRFPFEGDKDETDGATLENNFLSIENSVEIKQINAAEVIGVMKQEIEKDGNVSWDLMQKYLQDKYKIDIQVLNTFFKQPISLWLQPKFSLESMNDVLNLDNYEYVIALEDWSSADKEVALMSLESFIKNYFAFKYPTTRIKVLPDQSSGREVVANTDGFGFVEVRGSNSSLQDGIRKVMAIKNYELIYYADNEKFLLSNNDEFFERVLSGLEDSANREIEIEKELIDPRYIIEFDSGLLGGDYYLLGGRVRLGSSFLDDEVLVEGVFLGE